MLSTPHLAMWSNWEDPYVHKIQYTYIWELQYRLECCLALSDDNIDIDLCNESDIMSLMGGGGNQFGGEIWPNVCQL